MLKNTVKPLISIYEVLAEIDLLEDAEGNLKVFELTYFSTKKGCVGDKRNKKEVSKKLKLPKRSGELQEKQPSKYKGHHKRDQTIPLYDRGTPFKLKIFSIMAFNQKRCVRPIIKQGKLVYPHYDKQGNLVYE